MEMRRYVDVGWCLLWCMSRPTLALHNQFGRRRRRRYGHQSPDTVTSQTIGL